MCHFTNRRKKNKNKKNALLYKQDRIVLKKKDIRFGFFIVNNYLTIKIYKKYC